MNHAVNILPPLVLDGLMLCQLPALLERERIGRKLIGHNHFHIVGDIVVNDVLQGLCLRVGSVEKPEIAAALTDANDDFLPNSAAPKPVTNLFSANIRLIHFHDAAKMRLQSLFHSLADAMAEIPSGLVRYAKSALHLIGGDALAGLAHEIRGKEPFPERQVRVIEDGSRAYGELVAA